MKLEPFSCLISVGTPNWMKQLVKMWWWPRMIFSLKEWLLGSFIIWFDQPYNTHYKLSQTLHNCSQLWPLEILQDSELGLHKDNHSWVNYTPIPGFPYPGFCFHKDDHSWVNYVPLPGYPYPGLYVEGRMFSHLPLICTNYFRMILSHQATIVSKVTQWCISTSSSDNALLHNTDM